MGPQVGGAAALVAPILALKGLKESEREKPGESCDLLGHVVMQEGGARGRSTVRLYSATTRPPAALPQQESRSLPAWLFSVLVLS